MEKYQRDKKGTRMVKNGEDLHGLQLRTLNFSRRSSFQ